jgi:hypothetical protein
VSARSIVGIVNPGGNRPLWLRLHLLEGSFTVKTRLLHLGAIGMVSVGLLAGTTAAPDSSNSFSAVLTGDVKATISGGATFGRVAGGPTAPDVFTVSLGADSSQGAVLFTRPNSRSLKVGSYHVSDTGVTEGSVQALVMLGPSERPQGVFRASAGTLTITSISDYTITGLFSLDANGFLASKPDQEDQRVSVSGSFSARRSY